MTKHNAASAGKAVEALIRKVLDEVVPEELKPKLTITVTKPNSARMSLFAMISGERVFEAVLENRSLVTSAGTLTPYKDKHQGPLVGDIRPHLVEWIRKEIKHIQLVLAVKEMLPPEQNTFKVWFDERGFIQVQIVDLPPSLFKKALPGILKALEYTRFDREADLLCRTTRTTFFVCRFSSTETFALPELGS